MLDSHGSHGSHYDSHGSHGSHYDSHGSHYDSHGSHYDSHGSLARILVKLDPTRSTDELSSDFVGRGRGRWIRETLLSMASLFLLPRSPICPRRLLNRSLLRTFLLPRSSIALENRSFWQCLTTASHFRWKVLGQTLRCSRFYAANAGIVQSIYTIDIPEQSLPEFVMNNFHEHGDDIAMVGLNESLKLS